MAVLYRTYRPSTWNEVAGQEHVTGALREAIANKRLAHAYLFSGSRGTGKTTVARILAREVGTAAEDVYEIDAASNRGIDDIRELREHVSVLPFRSPYKIYIVDEVHMLSKDAWNALLKTLEEPPAHVIFILATTELDKVPETIVSRCQTFAFRKPPREIVRKEIARIGKKEGYELDAGASDLIAMLGDGSFRDALGMLEKVIMASPDKKITRAEVEAATGAPKAKLINDFVSHLIDKNEDAALAVLANAEKSGISMNTFVTLVLEKVRFILLASHSESSKPYVKEHLSPDDWEFVEGAAAKGKADRAKAVTPAMLSHLLEAAEAVNRARIEQLPLELAVVKICGIV
ncbi:MAG: polymerase subunit gamma/tau [Candidatus Parcubacteria bacterium]|nr:polymerase subunit gamma/tau [Candidatus Parcubacteria bacterium]